jgi:VanZ family protein
MIVIRFWKPVLWLVILVKLSLMAGNKLPSVPLLPHMDKLVHAVMYFILAFLLTRPVIRTGISKPYFWIILFCLVAGMLIEILQQYYALYRSGSILDEIANVAGAVLGILFFHYAIRNTRLEKWV